MNHVDYDISISILYDLEALKSRFVTALQPNIS